ncbi:MAG: DNA polymerase III subunit beta [Clostridiales bacterium]|nr:DNA polymerase III subunit beta [Clostridiales bacterium]
MLITTSKDNLNTAINAVQRAINAKSIIPSYSCIKLEVKGNTAVFTGAGLDVSIECTIPVQTDREGVALIPAKAFSDIVRRLPDLPITLEHSDSMEMSIRYERANFTLSTIASDDFPLMDIVQGSLVFSIAADPLKKLVRQSTFASSNDELKGVFTGILWELEAGDLSLIGTDTHRLAWTKAPVNQSEDLSSGSFIIPAKTTTEIARLLQNEDCQVKADQNIVSFTFDNIRIQCRVMEGSFPNYRQVIPERFVTSIQAESKTIRDAAERISLFAVMTELSSTIYLEIEDSALSVHSRSDIGFGREEIPVRQEGDDLHIAFNSRYITDFFKVAEEERVIIQLSGQLSAGIMKEESDDSFLYLVLPIKA